MVNWFDRASGAVRLVLIGAALASLLMAAAIPSAFTAPPALFAFAYVALQVGRNVAAVSLLGPDDALHGTFQRIVVWSAASVVLWIAGAFVPVTLRFAFWGPALAVDLAAPLAGYWTPKQRWATTCSWPTPIRR